MKANILVLVLSEKLGLDFETAQRIDRILAGAGIRAKGIGRKLPDMSRKEALTFLMAYMVNDQITKVVQQVKPWLEATGKVNKLPHFEPDPKWGILSDDSAAYLYHVSAKAYFDPIINERGELSLIDYLVAICDIIEAGIVAAENVDFEIQFTRSVAIVRGTDTHSKDVIFEDEFFPEFVNSSQNDQNKLMQFSVHRICKINGVVLSEIISKT